MRAVTPHSIRTEPRAEPVLRYLARQWPKGRDPVVAGSRPRNYWPRSHRRSSWRTARAARVRAGFLDQTAGSATPSSRVTTTKAINAASHGLPKAAAMAVITAAVPTLVEKRLVRDRDATSVAVTLGSCSVRHRRRVRTEAPWRTLLSEAKGAGTG